MRDLMPPSCRMPPLLLVAMLAGCGGGGGSAQPPSGGTATTAPSASIADQPVYTQSSFARASLCYFCNSANLKANQVTLDDESAPAWKVGSDAPVVARGILTTTTVRGAVRESSTRYDTLEARSAAVGPVEWIDLERGRIGVLGQEVQGYGDWAGRGRASVPPAESRQITELKIGQRVRVFGYDLEDGVIAGTGVRDAANDPERVTGTVSRLDAGARRLAVGGLEVDFARATIEGFPGGEVQAGDRIEVIVGGPVATRPLRAARLVYRDQPMTVEPGTRVSASGLARFPPRSRGLPASTGITGVRVGGVLLALESGCRSDFPASTRLARLFGRATAAGTLAPDDAGADCLLFPDYPSSTSTITGVLQRDVDASGRSRILDVDLQFQAATAWFARAGIAGDTAAFHAGDRVTVGLWAAGLAGRGIASYIEPATPSITPTAQARFEGWMTSDGVDHVIFLDRPMLIDERTQAALTDCNYSLDAVPANTPSAAFVGRAFTPYGTRWITADVAQNDGGGWYAVGIRAFQDPYCD